MIEKIINQCLQKHNDKYSLNCEYKENVVYNNGEFYFIITNYEYYTHIELHDFQINIEHKYLQDLLPIILDKIEQYIKLTLEKNILLKEVTLININPNQYIRDYKINKLK
ncbi:MAG: hypothetical protein M0R46_06340 [Candidatus Muirbacterium halophilum]|nr:hypothetical protein [Candidatus Muirbacterium halophilum]